MTDCVKRGRRGTVRSALLGVCAAVAVGALWGCGKATRPAKFNLPAADSRSSSPAAERVRAGAKDANLIVIVLDAARPDRFGFLGYERDTTPNADELMSAGVVFTEAYAAAANTNTSIASLFTSQFPDTHGVVGVMTPLTDGPATLAECMKGAGYRTACFTANSAIASCFGFARGFDEYHHVKRGAQGRARNISVAEGRVDAILMVEAVIPWLREHAGERLAAYLHFLEPHAPYNPPEPFATMFFGDAIAQRTRSVGVHLYDGNLAYVDHMVGKLLDELEALGLLDRSVIVLLADHGEAFGEHGLYYHGKAVYDELIRVPLAFRLPGECGVSPQVRSEVICLTDVMPTLLDLFGIEAPNTMQGRSRLGLLAGESEAEPGFSVTRSRGHDKTGGRKRPSGVSYALTVPRYTLILADEGRRVRLYDRKTDPRQQEDLALDRPELVARLRDRFEEWASTQRVVPVVLPGGNVFATSTRGVEVDASTRRQLEALGYLK